jgi:3-oxoacyl-[acyl-carrier-protein] synthase-3
MSIEAIASAVPSIKESAAEIAQQTGLEELFITEKIGVKWRHVLAPDETGVDLAEAACRKLFAQTDLKPGDVDDLIFVTQTPDHALPHSSALLAHRLGLSSSCAAFDIGLGCSGFVYALSVTESFLAGNAHENALLVTCDPYSRIMAREDKGTNAVFGDAAAVCWVRRTGTRCQLGRGDYGTDGSRAGALIVEAGRGKLPFVSVHESSLAQYSRDQLRLHMSGRDVFEFVMLQVPKSIGSCLERNGLTLAEIDWFALHQGSLYMLMAMAQRLEIPREKILINIDRFGNTVSSTVPMLLEELMRKEDLHDRKVLISGFGVGLSWATNILTFQY